MELASDSLCADFRVGGLLDLMKLFGSDCHSIHFKRGVIFLKSDEPLCPDDFMVTIPDGLATILYSPCLGLRPKTAPCNATEGPHPLLESLSCSSDGYLLCV